MSSHLVKKVKVPVKLDSIECYFFYSFACGECLLEKYGTPQKADNAFFKTFFVTDCDGKFVLDGDKPIQKPEGEIVNAELLRVLRDYVSALTITWAKENKCEPVDLFDLAIEDMWLVLDGVSRAIGLAMPKAEGEADPQTP